MQSRQVLLFRSLALAGCLLLVPVAGAQTQPPLQSIPKDPGQQSGPPEYSFIDPIQPSQPVPPNPPAAPPPLQSIPKDPGQQSDPPKYQFFDPVTREPLPDREQLRQLANEVEVRKFQLAMAQRDPAAATAALTNVVRIHVADPTATIGSLDDMRIIMNQNGEIQTISYRVVIGYANGTYICLVVTIQVRTAFVVIGPNVF
jgi:hypothetical protein